MQLRFLALGVLLFSIFSLGQAQNITPQGDTNAIEIANWNVEWYGDAGNGPSNETLQQSNVKNIIQKSNIDIWGLQEISSATAFTKLLSDLNNEYDYAISTWDQIQKTALIFKKETCRKLYAKNILAVYDREFASGRLPLEVALEINFKNRKDTIYLFVLHLKANTGNSTEKAAALDLRKRSSEALKEYLDENFKNRNVVVLGDWNDDVDVSIYNNQTTPFIKFVQDNDKYIFVTQPLSLAGERSTVSYNNVIDHQCISKSMHFYYISNTTKIFYLNSIVSNYSNTTSDHYPVISKYDFSRKSGSTNALQAENIDAFQSPFYFLEGMVRIRENRRISSVQIFNELGLKEEMKEIKPNRLYVYSFIENKKKYTGKMMIVKQN